MKPKMQKIQNISQGSDDPATPWARARFNFLKQILIRFKLLDTTTMADLIALPPTKQEQEAKILLKQKGMLVKEFIILLFNKQKVKR